MRALTLPPTAKGLVPRLSGECSELGEFSECGEFSEYDESSEFSESGESSKLDECEFGEFSESLALGSCCVLGT